MYLNNVIKLRAEKNAEFQSDVIRNRSFDATSSDNKCNVIRYSSKNGYLNTSFQKNIITKFNFLLSLFQM